MGTRDYDELTEQAKATLLGQKILKEMQATPLEMWVNDINSNGVIVGRLEIHSGKYESYGKDL